ncbi:MAG: DNA-binding protein [Acidimicrobiales bacterium]|nr:DNA-binding protein [Acidimicrobiales bacterium]
MVESADGSWIESPELDRLLHAAMADLAEGDVVMLGGNAQVSPAEAGELLGLSRQYVDRLIDDGQLTARHLPGSRHRRLRVADVLAFQRRRHDRQSKISSAVNAVVDAGAEY